jgi:hypothetical protein
MSCFEAIPSELLEHAKIDCVNHFLHILHRSNGLGTSVIIRVPGIGLSSDNCVGVIITDYGSLNAQGSGQSVVEIKVIKVKLNWDGNGSQLNILPVEGPIFNDAENQEARYRNQVIGILDFSRLVTART